MTRPLRAALSACGGISALALDAARTCPDFAITALQDIDARALQRVGDRHGIHRRHAAFEDLLTDDIDFVILNTPNDLHLGQVRAAAAAGKPCLVQKPMARNATEGEALVRAAADAGVAVGVVMFEHSRPVHHQVRAMVQSGWLGEPVAVEAIAAHTSYLRHPPPPHDWRRDPERVGGGAFLQLGVHPVNLAAWMLGRDPEQVSAITTGGHTVLADETTVATIAYPDGVIGRFTASWTADLWSFSVIGTEGRVHVLPDHVAVKGETAFEGDVFAYHDAGRECVFPMADLAGAIARLEPAFEVHGRFARWLAGGDPYPCPAERGLHDLRVADAVAEAARRGRTVSVERTGR